MRAFLVFAFLAVLVMSVHAWEKEDHEIFDLVSAIKASEGKDTDFYSWLDVASTASTAEIAKAYRKKSMVLQCVSPIWTACHVLKSLAARIKIPTTRPSTSGSRASASFPLSCGIKKAAIGHLWFPRYSSRLLTSMPDTTSSTRMVFPLGAALATIIHALDLVSEYVLVRSSEANRADIPAVCIDFLDSRHVRIPLHRATYHL